MSSPPPQRAMLDTVVVFRGNHLSNTTCLMQVFFESCESFGKLC